MVNRGFTTCLSGNDLCGKSTQSKLLAKVMKAELFSFPSYQTVYGQLIRASLTGSEVQLTRYFEEDTKTFAQISFDYLNKNDMNPYEIQCLQLLCRLRMQKTINDILFKGTNIVFDRYDIDGYVYGKIEGCDETWLKYFQSCIIPSDFIIILTGQIFKRDEQKDLNESNNEFMEKVREEYLYQALTNSYPIVRVPDTAPIDSIYYVHNEICNLVSNRFGIKIIPLGKEEIGELTSV